MSLSISLWENCRSIVSYLGFPALWENYPDFIHRQASPLYRSKALIQSTETKEKFSVIHRIVPDIVYKGI